MDFNDVKALALIGPNLTYGDFLLFKKSIENDENTPVNGTRYLFKASGKTFQILITWEEGLEPSEDTPLTGAFISLISDPEICAEMLTGDIGDIIRYTKAPPKKN